MSLQYTDEAKQQICDLRGIKSAAIIGAEFGISRNAVIGLWKRQRDRHGGALISTRPQQTIPRKQSSSGSSYIRVRTPEEMARKAQRQRERRAAASALRVPSARVRAGTKKAKAIVERQQILRADAPQSLRLSLLDLNGQTCRWPEGDGPFFFCGHAPHGESSYCTFHHHLGTSAP